MTGFTDVELEALLERPIRHLLSAADRRAFAGRRVLITGGGGSVGSELARQIAACGPERLTLLDHSELNLFQIERELMERFPGVAIDPVLADITRASFVHQAFTAARPQVVYHAAAYKHVTMAERAVCAAVAVNVLGTAQIVDAARDAGARFVLISSDKAASPRSVMGATKRVAELLVRGRASATFRPIIVRFGNVLGSSGSVLEIMRERIRAGLAVPITDDDATRYFMTAGEAVSLVMKTDLLARSVATYWLDMGKPVRIGDLAARLMDLEVAAGYARVPSEIVGLRAGEKLREELTDQGLRMCRTKHPRIWVATQAMSSAEAIDRAVRALRRHVASGNAGEALAAISSVVPEFTASVEAWRQARAQSLHRAVAGPRREGRTA
jgi:FlaA1/EpsC-like NDP-sugar epimerase